MHIVRQWREVKRMTRGKRGHKKGGTKGTKQGELALPRMSPTGLESAGGLGTDGGGVSVCIKYKNGIRMLMEEQVHLLPVPCSRREFPIVQPERLV